MPQAPHKPRPARRGRAPQKITWHVARRLQAIEHPAPAKGTERRGDLEFISGSQHEVRGAVASQFLDKATGRILEVHRSHVPGIGWTETWYLLDDSENPAAVGDRIHDGRYTVSKKKSTPRKTTTDPKPSDHPRARKALLFGKHSPTSVARWIGANGGSPGQALHVLQELGATTTLQSMRTFVYAGKAGERGELPELSKDEVKQVKSLMAAAPAPAAGGGGRARMVLWGHPATAVLRWMGKDGFTKEQAAAAMASLVGDKELERSPSPASIGIFLQAGRAGRRGDPAELSKEHIAKLRAFKSEDAVRKAKVRKSAAAMDAAKAKTKRSGTGRKPVRPAVEEKAAAASATA